ncbi:MAG: hypothetical protein KF878_19950 [Planctomycetes bacterium]|nr:hypothetical protein [Planctomycetota bacterium]MCW8139763.1 hypothetical protein [Planctomycetota bacterium]
MKLKDFLQRLPEPFAIELLEALPAPDRRELLRRHGAKVAVSAGSLKRATRLSKEARLLVQALQRSDDPDEARTFLQGWLARRAEMVVHFLDAWKVKHQGGIVEDFSWVEKLEADTVKASLEGLDPKLEPIAPLVYFVYLELPVTERVLAVDALFKSLEQQPSVE